MVFVQEIHLIVIQIYFSLISETRVIFAEEENQAVKSRPLSNSGDLYAQHKARVPARGLTS
jgi:hypothetical protein